MTPKTAALLADPPPRTHMVYPYGNFDQIVPVVARFAGEGIARSESIVLMVTDEHRQAITERLVQASLDAHVLEGQRRLIFLDAAENTLLHDAPNPAAFDALVGAAVRQGIASPPSGKVPVCGKTVNDLCSCGSAEAAVQMEELWNSLDASHYVPVLCGYSLDALRPVGQGLRDRLVHAHNHDLASQNN
ncbi:MAG TPA: MEDS domain-containing protein [Bryobacteraceae bacterium]|nr:MEDS domain-containing protein [Bryobacteraceae bacterium]